MTGERPILFSGAMVRAILDGRKTQTRRILKPQPDMSLIRPEYQDPNLWEFRKRFMFYEDGWSGHEHAFIRKDDPSDMPVWQHRSPYGEPGDRLWVRETWAQPAALDPGPTVYRADYPACVPAGFENIPPADAITWKPSIHMPRALCRQVLEVTGVRVERLNDCSRADAIAEGIAPELEGWADYSNPSCQMCLDPVDSYRTLWDSINGAGAWEANPWVWVVEFRRAA